MLHLQNALQVGFDDVPLASYVEPTLTTVAQPKMEMGRRAAEMVLELMLGDAERDGDLVSNVVVEGELIVRESSGAT